ncbi:MAG: hypothetical protein A3K22_05915 [Deltaproteobacteria bacterium RBG_16_42_7]|nr:MAG: hypothetical protein A3K22_05915 [Deltaproteobacteria bacterium RBG_16_42_7]
MIAQGMIERAFRLVGIKSPTSTKLADGLIVLNMMLGSWSADKLLIYTTQEENFSLTATDGIYTLGSGGDFNTSRPQRIIQAFIRDSSGYDYPLAINIIQDYNDLTLKTTPGRPTGISYFSDYPLATIKLYPVPDAAYTLYLSSLKPFTSFSTLTTEAVFPPGYEDALVSNLAVKLAAEEDIKMIDTVYADAVTLKKILKENTVPITQEVSFDAALVSVSRGYNIFTDGD